MISMIKAKYTHHISIWTVVTDPRQLSFSVGVKETKGRRIFILIKGILDREASRCLFSFLVYFLGRGWLALGIH
jgi:hypothetical protein